MTTQTYDDTKWRLVPTEPTPEMLSVFDQDPKFTLRYSKMNPPFTKYEVVNDATFEVVAAGASANSAWTSALRLHRESCYRDMLSVAPQPEQDTAHVDNNDIYKLFQATGLHHERWPGFRTGWLAGSQAEPGDLRALKRRIHELEGEVLGYKRILTEQEKQREQAPVAFVYHDSVGEHYTDDQNEIWNGDGIESWTPLYAVPAPQSPPKVKTLLTGEQLRNIARVYRANDQQRMRDHWELFVSFARDVEVAHGITGETK